ncbi:MAG: hypothetical protein IIC60_00650 [Proteobacteria bacterium]|nr:hypothetical protein [Pseudomonadota bacterium]
MNRKLLNNLPGTLLVLLGISCSSLVFAQAEDWRLTYTADGHPDFQGVWANNSITPLERAEGFENRETLTEEEYARLQAGVAKIISGGGDAQFGDGFFAALVSGEVESYDPSTGNYDQTWMSDRNLENRTSLIVYPLDGKLPAYTDVAQAKIDARIEHVEAHPADSWTDRPLQERCITYGMPYLLAGYNSYYQIVQSKEHVAIIQEMIHDVRVIPLVPKPHIDEKIRLWHGDSRGYWDGETLVIETKNFSEASELKGSGGNRYFIERLTRTARDNLRYQFTIEDESTWISPWTAIINYSSSPDPIFEYACHEGNYGLSGILSGHRAQERAAQ